MRINLIHRTKSWSDLFLVYKTFCFIYKKKSKNKKNSDVIYWFGFKPNKSFNKKYLKDI